MKNLLTIFAMLTFVVSCKKDPESPPAYNPRQFFTGSGMLLILLADFTLQHTPVTKDWLSKPLMICFSFFEN